MKSCSYKYEFSSLVKGIALGVGILLLAGCGGGQQSSDNTGGTTPPTTPSPPRAPMGMGMMPPGGPAGFGATMPQRGASTQTASTAATGGKKGTPTFTGKYHQDPFYITWKRKPLPPDVFAEVQPLQVADTSVEAPPAKPTVVAQLPDRRVAGIMRGNGIYAILEQNGQSEIVKPGSLTSDNYRVVAIGDDSVKLEKREGNLILVQNVQLSDLQTAASSLGRGAYPGAGGYPGYGGFPGYPGAPGMGGRPGIARPGGPGFGGGGNPGGSD